MALPTVGCFGGQLNHLRSVRFCGANHVTSRSCLFTAEIELSDLLRRLGILDSGIMNSVSSCCIAAKQMWEILPRILAFCISQFFLKRGCGQYTAHILNTHQYQRLYGGLHQKSYTRAKVGTADEGPHCDKIKPIKKKEDLDSSFATPFVTSNKSKVYSLYAFYRGILLGGTLIDTL